MVQQVVIILLIKQKMKELACLLHSLWRKTMFVGLAFGSWSDNRERQAEERERGRSNLRERQKLHGLWQYDWHDKVRDI